MARINQKENYNADFGYCLRSSSIFYVPPYPVKTKIVLSDYWKFKNNIKVFLLVNYRNMDGKLLYRKSINFNNKNVLELRMPCDFNGSCEVEAFSNEDLKIPYSAIMAVYECQDSISMVHSYSRTYSQVEIEEQRTISDGFEGCWTLREGENITSYAVFHNGSSALPEQKIKMEVTNFKGQKRIIEFPCEELKPFETRIIRPIKYFEKLGNFLLDHDGSCKIRFKLSNSFSRILLCWESIDKKQLQITHSNFDYSFHETDLIISDYNFGHMVVPKIENKKIETLIYPDRSPGIYSYSSDAIKETEIPDKLHSFRTKPQDIIFKRLDGNLPSRLVTAIKIQSDCQETIPCECSLGIYHNLRPPKRFHWALWSYKFNSSVLITSLKKLYGDPKNSEIILKIYSQRTKEIRELILKWDDISKDQMNANLKIKDLVDEEFIDKEDFMYISIFSHYGGYIMFTTLEKGNSFSIEHSF